MTITPDQIEKITGNIGKARILILGDIMLDEYLYGSVSRISPEAPVPVVEINDEQLRLGGAANVANNIAALGDSPCLLGVVGEDEAAVKLSQLLKAKDISREYLVNDSYRRTTMKTRVIAHSQQVVRADREDAVELSPEIEKLVMERFTSLLGYISGVIISDYGKGVITASLLDKVIPACRAKGIFVAVDPKESHFFRYKKVSVVTPNHHEAGFVAGRRIKTDNDLQEVGRMLLAKLESDSILITRGEKGMALFLANGEIEYIPTVARKVFDVTGAGDTVIASLVSAVAAGASLKEATIISNCAAGIVVGEIGTATVSSEQLKNEVKRYAARA